MLSFTPNPQNNDNIAERLPTEIILEFAPYLDRPSLFKALHVCRRWSEILSHVAWPSISKTDWHFPYFPIQQRDETSESLDDSLLSPFILYVQTLEWQNNMSLISTGVVPQPQIQIPTARLARILTMAPNLTTLSLRMVDDHPDPSLFESIRFATSTTSSNSTSICPHNHLGSLSRLCSCFSRNSKSLVSTDPEKATTTTPEEQQHWKLKQLTIDSLNAAALLQHCSALEELRIFHPRYRTIAQEHAASGAVAWKLRRPSNLKTLEIYCARKASAYSFKVHDVNKEDPFRPHLLLCWEPQEWWSTQDIAAVF
ncbi:hypothetical protein BGW39_000405 [Mortierella sp. 14UC]|nr:hypothetical protein BGW39_000405 [Mortierella sp. 14UC]